MGAEPWAIPVGTLSAICVAGIIFIWWWFPRTWKKGTQQELAIIAEEGRLNRLKQAQETSSAEKVPGEGEGETIAKPPKAFVYTPQAIATY